MLGLVQAVHGQPAVRRIPGQHGSKYLGHRIRRTKPERLEEPPGGRDRGQRRMHHRQPVFPARPARHRTGSRPAGPQRTAARQAGAKRAVVKETVVRQAAIRPPGIRRASVKQTYARQIGVRQAVARRADRGTGSRKEHGGLPGRVDRRHLAAISQPDDRRGSGRSRHFASRAWFPQIRVPVQEPVQLRDPFMRLARQELSSQPRGERLRGDQLSAGRVEQEPPQPGRGLSRHRRADQRRRPSQRAMRFGARRQGGQQGLQRWVSGQRQFPRAGPAAGFGRQERVAGQRLAGRVIQTAQQRAGREPRLVQRKRVQHASGQQAVVAQPGQHLREQNRGLPGQVLVDGVVFRHVVAGRGGPVRPLNQEPEKALLLRREERHDRRRGQHSRLRPVRPVAQRHGDLHPLPARQISRLLTGYPGARRLKTS